MTKYIVIAGKANKPIVDLFKPQKDIEIIGTFSNSSQLADALLETGSAFLQDVEAILLLDYGFQSMNPLKRIKEFIYLQDTLNVNKLENTGLKLYLATKDSDIYRELNNQESGMPSILYLYMEAFLMEKYSNKILVDILKGARHKRGIYNKEIDKLNVASKLQEQQQKFIEESKTFNRNILNIGKEDSLSIFTKDDYMDSAVVENKIMNEKAEAKKLARQKVLEERKRAKVKPDINIKDEEVPELKITLTRRGEQPIPTPVQSSVKINNKSSIDTLREVQNDILANTDNKSINKTEIPEILEIKEIFDSLAFKKGGDVVGKLSSDNGIIAMSSYLNSGASSLISNLADIYALSGKKVLIIDLDIDKKTQTSVYFPSYDMEVSNHYGVSDGLLNVINGGVLQSNTVEISSRVSILGVSPSIHVPESTLDRIKDSIDLILEDSRTIYDIILVDVPSNLVYQLYPFLVESIDKNIFVVDNKAYNIEFYIDKFIPKLAKLNEDLFEALLLKSDILINKFKRSNKDTNGEESGQKQLYTILMNKEYPYDRINILGELPYYDDWNTQFSESLRYVWLNEQAMGIYRYYFSKVVW